jgi:hypothetical protein
MAQAGRQVLARISWIKLILWHGLLLLALGTFAVWGVELYRQPGDRLHPLLWLTIAMVGVWLAIDALWGTVQAILNRGHALWVSGDALHAYRWAKAIPLADIRKVHGQRLVWSWFADPGIWAFPELKVTANGRGRRLFTEVLDRSAADLAEHLNAILAEMPPAAAQAR